MKEPTMITHEPIIRFKDENRIAMYWNTTLEKMAKNRDVLCTVSVQHFIKNRHRTMLERLRDQNKLTKCITKLRGVSLKSIAAGQIINGNERSEASFFIIMDDKQQSYFAQDGTVDENGDKIEFSIIIDEEVTYRGLEIKPSQIISMEFE